MKTLYRFRPLGHSIEWNYSRKKTLLFVLYILLSLAGFAADAAGSMAKADHACFVAPVPGRVANAGISFCNDNIQPNINNNTTAFLPVKPRNDR